jgi:hypothetical protein
MESALITKYLAFMGLIMIIISVVIGAWVSIENKKIADDDWEGEDANDSKNRTAFFYTRDTWMLGLDLDNSYVFNPVGAYSGFNFVILISGLSFIFYAFHRSISDGEDIPSKIAMAGILITVISIILGAWVAHEQYQFVRETNAGEIWITEITGLYEDLESLYIPRAINAGLIFMGPGLILYAIYLEKVKNPPDLHKYLALAGIAILILALILAIFSGVYARKMIQEMTDEESDDDEIESLFEKRAFISMLFPYIPILGMGLIFYPYLKQHYSKSLNDGLTEKLVNGGLILVGAGILLTLYAAYSYHGMYENGDNALTDFIESTGSTMVGLAFMTLGMCLMGFPLIFGQQSSDSLMDRMKMQNLGSLGLAVVGTLMGSILGYWRFTAEGEVSSFYYLFEYLFQILLFAGLGLMVFTWTQREDLFIKVRHTCPHCGYEVNHVKEWDSWFCESCDDYVDEPTTTELRSCPACQGELDYVDQYELWFCNICGKYESELTQRSTEVTKKKSKKRKKKSAKGGTRKSGSSRSPGKSRSSAGQRSGASGATRSPGQRVIKCRNCRQAMEYIPQYDKWYCYTCARYGGPPSAYENPIYEEEAWEIFSCPMCGLSNEVKSHKRPLNINCSRCGHHSVLH